MIKSLAKKLLRQKYKHRQNLFKVNKNVRSNFVESKMNYSESETDFSFAINSVSDLDSASKSDSKSNSNSESESDFSLGFVNLDIFIIFHPIFTLF